MLVKPVDDERAFYDLLDEDAPWELLDGRLVMSPALERHENLFRFLLTLLSAFLDERGGALVRGSRYPMRLDERWSPQPDLLVVLEAHHSRVTEQRLEGPADFVVEIASEGDPRLAEREKLPRYRAAATGEIWLLHDRRRIVRVDRRREDGTYDSVEMAAGRLASTVVDGFWIDVGWLWHEVLPPTLACLRQILEDTELRQR